MVSPDEVLLPDVRVSMKEWNTFPRARVDCMLACGLMAVATRTGKAEVLENCLTTLDQRGNVFGLESHDCQNLSCATVGTAISKMLPNPAP